MCRWIKFANGLDLIAKELDAKRAISFRRVNIEDAAAQSVFSGHFHHIGRGVAHGIKVTQQGFGIKCLPAPQNPRQIGVVFRGTQPQRSGSDRGNYDGHCARGNFPKSYGSFFLNFRMRGKILEGQDVARGKGDYRFRFGADQLGKSLQYGNKLFQHVIVGDHDNKRPLGNLLQQN